MENGLSAFIFSEVVVVKYAEATPVFIKSNFKQNVSEFAAENEEVLRVNATSFNLIGRLIYTVVGKWIASLAHLVWKPPKGNWQTV